MNSLESITPIFDAVFPLLMLFYGVVLGLELADWLASRRNKRRKTEADKQEANKKSDLSRTGNAGKEDRA